MARSYSEILIKRILISLREKGPLRKLNLSLYSMTNFQTCMAYIQFLNRLRWISITSENSGNRKFTIIKITEQGRDVLNLLSQE